MKRFAGWPAYVASGLRHLRDPMMQVRLRIDDGPAHATGRLARCWSETSGSCEGGLELLPDAAGRRRLARCGHRCAADTARLARIGVARDPCVTARGDPHLERLQGPLDRRSRPTGSVPRQMDGEVIADGRSLDARVESGALVVRAPQTVATAA